MNEAPSTPQIDPDPLSWRDRTAAYVVVVPVELRVVVTGGGDDLHGLEDVLLPESLSRDEQFAQREPICGQTRGTRAVPVAASKTIGAIVTKTGVHVAFVEQRSEQRVGAVYAGVENADSGGVRARNLQTLRRILRELALEATV